MPVSKKSLDNLVKFDASNQPSREARINGWKKRKEAQALGNLVITDSSRKAVTKKLCEYIGIGNLKEVNLTTLLTLRQIEKALKQGDTQAYNAVMNRLVGPVSETLMNGDAGAGTVNNTQINISKLENMSVNERKKIERGIFQLLKADTK